MKDYGSNEILALDDCIITHPKKVQSFKDDKNMLNLRILCKEFIFAK